MQRVKGAQFEVEVARMLRRTLYPEARRGLVQTRSAKEDADVTGTPWWVEAKRGRTVSTIAALKQAEEATDGRPALVVVRFDHEQPYVALRFEDFEVLARTREVLEILAADLPEAVRLAKRVFDERIAASKKADDEALEAKVAKRCVKPAVAAKAALTKGRARK